MLSYYNHDLSEYKISVNISAQPYLVFSAWAAQGDMESWGMKEASFWSSEGEKLLPGELIEKDNTFTWLWHNWPGCIIEGRVESIEANRQIIFDLRSAGKVTITCEKTNLGYTKLSLFQNNFDFTQPNSYTLECWLYSWSFWLVNLKAFLEYGISLSETNIPKNVNDKVEVVNH